MTRLLVASIVGLSLAHAADKPQPVVVGWWQGVPATAPLNRAIDLTLRVSASRDAPDLLVDILPTAGVEIVGGDAPWAGSLSKGQTRDLRVSVRFVADGTWTLGASIANRSRELPQVAGTVLTIVARNGIATLTPQSRPIRGPRATEPIFALPFFR